MGFEQYHEPASELSAETRTFARMIASLTEEAEAIGWYQQRISLETGCRRTGDHGERATGGVQALRDGPRVPDSGKARSGASTLERILFKPGDIVEHGEEAEEAEDAAS